MTLAPLTVPWATPSPASRSKVDRASVMFASSPHLHVPLRCSLNTYYVPGTALGTALVRWAYVPASYL